MSPRNRRIIDPAAIEQNMRLIRSAVPQTAKVMAVVKADGYGHGAAETAQAAIRGGAEMLAVATSYEGAQLRENGIQIPILVLSAVTAAEVNCGVENDLIQTICSPEMAYLCEEAAGQKRKQTKVHLKVDTGMGRIGVRTPEERDRVMRALEKCPHVLLTGVFTHFSDADGNEDSERYTRRQFQRFLDMTRSLPDDLIRHCCNSASIHRFPEMSLDMVRAGISLYGYPPVKTDLPLKPCMSWTAVLSFIKDLPSGSYVSYGRTFYSETSLRIGTVTCGYGDGYHRLAGEKGHVLIRGKKARILGRVCMDQMLVDLTEIPDASEGDEVILMGQSGSESITAEDIASWCNTISYEVLLSTGSRVERVYSSNI